MLMIFNAYGVNGILFACAYALLFMQSTVNNHELHRAHAVEYLLYQNLVGVISHLDIYLPSANQIAGFVTTMIYKIHAYRDARCNCLTIRVIGNPL